jgi:hypothetical protein
MRHLQQMRRPFAFFLLALTVLGVAVAAPAAFSKQSAGQAATGQRIEKLCLVYDHDDSAGMYCVDDSKAFRPAAIGIDVTSGAHDWALATVNGPGHLRLVCMRHTSRYYSKGYSGNSGLSCVKEADSPPQGFTVSGTSIRDYSWWWNKVDAGRQGHLNCLTWEHYGAGIWCQRSPWPALTPNITGTQISSDWWVNRVQSEGQPTLLCVTWEGAGSDSGSLDCFRQEHPWTGTPTLKGTKVSSRWGVNQLDIPGQVRRWCLAYDNSGNGGLSCFKDEATLNPSTLTARKYDLGGHWSAWRITLG